jgi:hypothetical protein
MSINAAGIKLSSAFNLRTPVPLDLRTVRDNILDRDSIPEVYRHEGMPCYIKSNKVLYRLRGGVTNEHWVPECCIKYNLTAIEDPQPYNNEEEGYSVGSIWYNVDNGNTFLLTNFVAGNAVWIQINGFNWTGVLW